MANRELSLKPSWPRESISILTLAVVGKSDNFEYDKASKETTNHCFVKNSYPKGSSYMSRDYLAAFRTCHVQS